MQDSIEVAIPHIPRPFLSHPGSRYVLPHDAAEADRLHLQHKIIKTAFNGKLLLAPYRENGSYIVLDSGVGAGSWLLDFSTCISPSAILHGIDIEDRLFPKDRPRNISFSMGSVTILPLEWSDRFDFVHQRLLLTALRESEWKAAVLEMHRVLRPGGWIQLGEVGSWHSGPVTERHRQLLFALFQSRELLLDVHKDIPDLLRANDFQNITVERRSMPLGKWAGQKGVDVRDNYIEAFRGVKTPILMAGGLGFVKSEAELDNMLDDLWKEWDETEGSEVYFYIVIAQKAIA